MNRYDYIIAGAGAAGLSLVMHMIDSGQFTNKTILIVDQSTKVKNDRTWCFWEERAGLFESIVYKRWRAMWFHGVDGVSKLHETAPYEYKMIRGIDFYQYSFDSIKKQKNISVRFGLIQEIHSDNKDTYIVLDDNRIDAEFIFSSIQANAIPKNIKNNYFLWQQFKGWFIRTGKDLFNPEEATLMDFRINQHADTRFVYVMPFSANHALIEYTSFSETVIADEEYNQHLAEYCKSTLRVDRDEFEITEEEVGMIPMTNHAFPLSHHNIVYIGSAGGQTKASSGYTFRFIQKHSRQIINELVKRNSPFMESSYKKFDFYDSVLLKILVQKKLPGAFVFTQLFERNEMHEVFKFLDNETSLTEDLKLVASLPKGKFISAAISHLLQ